jgi:hypothetical protein
VIGRPSSSRCSTAGEVVTLIAVTQKQVGEWWNRNPMSYGVGSPIVAEPA